MAKATEAAQGMLKGLYETAQAAGIMSTFTNEKGNRYFSTKMQNFSPVRIEWDENGKHYHGFLSGQLNLNVTAIREGIPQAERAAASFDAAVAAMTPDERRRKAEELLNSL